MNRAFGPVVATVLIGHHDGPLRRQLRDALGAHGVQVLGTPHASEVRGAAADYPIDAFLAGGSLDGRTPGIELIEELAAVHAVPGVLLVTETDPSALRHLASPAVFGCVAWPLSPLQLYATVRSAAAHRDALRRERELRALGRRLSSVQAALARAIDGADDAGAAPIARELAPGFSPRERQVLRLLLAHKRPKTIAAQLGISPSTVRNHLKSMFAKVGVASQEDLLDLVMRTEG